MPTAAEAAASTGGSQRSQDVRRTVGMSVTTVNAGGQPSPASASKPSTSSAAAATAEDDDDDEEIEVLKEQSLDEVLEVRSFCADIQWDFHACPIKRSE